MNDLLFRNGRIVDGSGNPWFKGSVAIAGSRISALGAEAEQAEAARVIDIPGKVICPGFVDTHSHSDLRILAAPLSEAKVLQGVTTDNLGLDSYSLAPIRDEAKEEWPCCSQAWPERAPSLGLGIPLPNTWMP